jgi:hypothetical protein
MEKLLTDKQLHSRLNKYYKKHFGELDTDEWYVNPANNVWKFKRDGKTIILKCHVVTGEVTEENR